ncbi:MAG: glycosyltransferase family 2 protein [Chitinophagaceae bacterium]|nr:glycosyltransferase family 2 protein [Chitinophagaceae bacterium]
MDMNERVTFSVVIPMYNRQHLIKETIESVFNQNIEETIEVVVVDDGSTDNSAEVVKSIQDERVKYIHQENAGANKARNTGILAARGEYIALLDSDDKFLPHHLSNAFEYLMSNPNSVVYGRIIVDRGGGRTFIKPPRSIMKGEHMAEYLLCDRGFLQTSTLVLSTQLAKDVLFSEWLPFGQDTDFAIRLFSKGASFFLMEEPSVVWLDISDGNRISSKSRPDVREKWLNEVRPLITSKAYVGDKGWFVAKAYARRGHYVKAFKLYANALLKGCYNFRHSMVVGFQVFFPANIYRRIADLYIGLKKK